MSCEVRRKRKSCEVEGSDPELVKRGRLSENETQSLVDSPEVASKTNADSPNSADSPTSASSISSNVTEDSPKEDVDSPKSTTSGIISEAEEPEIVNISSFTRHEPVDPTVPRVLKSALKKSTEKKSLRFNTVQEFRFNRIQSFVTMPSYGGYSLGMDKVHYNGRELSLDKYRAEREQSRRRKMRRWRKRHQQVDVVADSSSSDSDSDDDSASEQLGMAPVPPDRRRRLLERSLGFDHDRDFTHWDFEVFIDHKVPRQYHMTIYDNRAHSAHNDQHIRNSRELCGCTCQGICYPESCQCYANGIGCQVDRSDRSFPCGCQPQQCWNPNGRTSFNAERVKSHFIRTMNRINSNEPLPEVPQSSQHFSFGDFTKPMGDPPRRDPYLHYWSYNWPGDPYHNIGMPNWTPDNFYYDMISNQAPPNPIQPESTNQKKEESESSSESGIGDETSSSSPPAVTPFLCGSIETSITVAYQDEQQQQQTAVPVGSE